MKIKKSLNIILLFSILLPLLFLQGCVLTPFASKFDTGNYLIPQKDKVGQSSQILLVTDDSFFIFTRAKLYVMKKSGNIWKMAFEPMKAVIGRNGFADTGEKREGDGKTPSGIYTLKLTFGYEKYVKTKMPYRQALTDDVWVDDVNADDYNRWTKKQKTHAASYEMMKRDDDLYKYGIVIGYNTAPVIKGNGSAIFLHIWKGEGIPTAGCVAVSEENLIKILEWLDPSALPLIIMGIEN
jgi:L,D-peptidoglycan transpeptidase YkuD (ErfK/YbiS/YcfS/YnhG family)